MVHVLAVGNQHRVVILALALKHLEVVETGGGGLQVPFTDDCRLVSCCTKQFGCGLLGTVKASLIGQLTV